jgi:uncharacterized membrane protein YfcA
MDPVVVALGLGIGILVGMTGMGGASLMTPLLILVVGTAPVTAIGTDIFYGAVTKTVGGWRHLKQHTVHLGMVFWLAVGSVPAALAGVSVIEFLQHHYGEDTVNQVALGMVGAALMVVGVATLIRSLFLRDVIPDRYAMHMYRRHKITAVITGLVTGFIIGLTSAGSGTLIAIVLIAVFRLTPQRVVGTDIVHAAVLLWAAGLANWVGSNIDFGLAANILVGSIPGVLIGAHFSTRVPQQLLRNALGVVLCASSVALLIKEQSPASVLVPAFAVAGEMIFGLLVFQAMLHRQHQPKPQPSPS